MCAEMEGERAPKLPRSFSCACTTYCPRKFAASRPSAHSFSISSGSVTPAADCRVQHKHLMSPEEQLSLVTGSSVNLELVSLTSDFSPF